MTEPWSWPSAPAHLAGFALDEWNRVAGPLSDMGVAIALDAVTLEIYCDAFGQLRHTLLALDRMTENDPAVGVMRNTIAELRRDVREFAKQFTITLPARALFEAGPKAEMDAIARKWSIL